MKKLLAILLLCLTPFTAQAQSSKSTVISAINVDFTDNTAGAITAALLRTVTTQMVSSYVDFVLCGSQGGIAYWDGSATPAPACLAKGTNGQVLRTYPTPIWDSLANFLTAGTGISIAGTITPTVTLSASASMVGAVPTTRIISSGAGLLGGGDLSADRTLSISATIAAAGPIGSTTSTPVITFNDKGQLTTVTSATISTGSLGAVPTSRIISSGAGLSGGGDLSADRTLTVATNGVTNAMLAQSAAATLHGNPTAALANIQSFTIQGLTALASPAATQDFLPIYDHLTGTIKSATPQAVASASVAGVSSLNTLTGALTFSVTEQSFCASGCTTTIASGSTGTYTPTTGMKYVEFTCYGSGGAGGGAATTATGFTSGGGGGAGGKSIAIASAATVGASQTVTIGALGAAAAAGANNGSAGADVSMGALCIGKGGSGGLGAAVNTGAVGGAGGVAGTGNTAKGTGQPGATGVGAAIQTVGAYVNFGGSTDMGGGGQAPAQTTGIAGTGYGSGGSGGNTFSTAVAGGPGTAGIVIAREFVIN